MGMGHIKQDWCAGKKSKGKIVKLSANVLNLSESGKKNIHILTLYTKVRNHNNSLLSEVFSKDIHTFL